MFSLVGPGRWLVRLARPRSCVRRAIALLWIEGFEALGTSINSGPTPATYLAGKYPYSLVPQYAVLCAGRLGGYAMRGDSGSFVIRTAALTTADTLICGLGINPSYNETM